MCGRFHVGEELIRRLENHFPNLSGKPAAGDVYPSREAAILFWADGKGGRRGRCRPGSCGGDMRWHLTPVC